MSNFSRLFSVTHGRLLGVHNPLGSDSGKASDPYINLRTLARLTNSRQKDVREAAIINLAQRITPENILRFSNIFGKDILAAAIDMTTKAVRLSIAILIESNGGAPQVSYAALESLKKSSLSRNELEFLSQTKDPNILRFIVLQGRTPAHIIAGIIEKKTSFTLETIKGPIGHWAGYVLTYEEEALSGKDPAYGGPSYGRHFIETTPGEYKKIYRVEELTNIINAHSAEKQKLIVGELRELNADLARVLEQKIK